MFFAKIVPSPSIFLCITRGTGLCEIFLDREGPGETFGDKTDRQICIILGASSSSQIKMPNKKKNNQARNAFYFFMVSLRPQLERQGVILENGMQSLAEIAGPRWKVGFVLISALMNGGFSSNMF